MRMQHVTGHTYTGRVEHAISSGSWEYTRDNLSLCSGSLLTGGTFAPVTKVTCRRCLTVLSAEAATDSYVSEAVDAAVECLLWSETDPEESLFDAEDVTSDSRARLREIVSDLLSHRKTRRIVHCHGISAGQFGHDVILSANHHGTGFWDRGYGPDGKWLHDMTVPHGELSLYETPAGMVALDG